SLWSSPPADAGAGPTNQCLVRTVGGDAAARVSGLSDSAQRESSARCMLKDWVRHYNEGRPQMSLGPGIPAHPHNKERTSTAVEDGKSGIDFQPGVQSRPSPSLADSTTSTAWRKKAA